jgi:hypothetical protein
MKVFVGVLLVLSGLTYVQGHMEFDPVAAISEKASTVIYQGSTEALCGAAALSTGENDCGVVLMTPAEIAAAKAVAARG